MARRKQKKRSLPGLLLHGLLSLVDFICEGIAFLCMGVFRGAGKLLLFTLKNIWRLLCMLAWLLMQPFAWLWRRATGRYLHAGLCEKQTGVEFEEYVALLLKDHYYRHVELTKGSGDQGVDILCERNGKTYAVQCKNYAGAVGNFAVQEAYAGAQYYDCDIAVVVCPGTFSRGAKELAESTGVTLWDEETLTRMMRKSGRRPKHRKS